MTNGASIAGLERRLAANPSSPLFARLAMGLLAHGETGRAESLCERGLELYPHYATGRLVLARCHAARGRYTEALRELHGIAGEYPGNVVLADFAGQWEAMAAAEGVAVMADDGAEFFEVVDGDLPDAVVVTTKESVPAIDHTEVLKPEGVEPPMPVPSFHAPAVPILPPLPAMPAPAVRPAAETAPGAPVARITTASIERSSFIEGDRIVSRTLAEIYASQGAIGEAVATYRLLIGRMPSERMAERLRELEERLGEDIGPRPEPKE